jgi:hypothetical protein
MRKEITLKWGEPRTKKRNLFIISIGIHWFRGCYPKNKRLI